MSCRSIWTDSFEPVRLIDRLADPNQAAPVNSMRTRLSLLLAFLVGGCGNQPANAPASPSPAGTSSATPSNPSPVTPTPAAPSSTAKAESKEPHYHLDKAQAKLPLVPIRIGTKSMNAELCTTLTQVSTGLMYRPGIGPDDGMLFVFAAPNRRSFYMRNVDFDISVAYIDDEGVIQEIVTLKKRDESPVPSKSDRIQFVLETATDWFSRNGIGVGTLIRTEQGTLKETLARFAQLR